MISPASLPRSTSEREKILKKSKLKYDKERGVIQQRQNLNLFMEEFVANGGDATAAAMRTGDYKNRASAAAMGSYYLKQAKSIGRLYMEKKGVGYGKMIDHALKKMRKSKDTAWWDRLMKLADYEDFMTKGGGQKNTVNIVQTQAKIQSEFGFGDQVIDGEIADG